MFVFRLWFRASLKHHGKTNMRRFSRPLVELQDCWCPQGFLFLSTHLLLTPPAASLSSRQHVRNKNNFLLWSPTVDLLTRCCKYYQVIFILNTFIILAVNNHEYVPTAGLDSAAEKHNEVRGFYLFIYYSVYTDGAEVRFCFWKKHQEKQKSITNISMFTVWA